MPSAEAKYIGIVDLKQAKNMQNQTKNIYEDINGLPLQEK